MAKKLKFLSRNSGRRPRHALLAAEPQEARQATARARRQADHDPADRGAPAAACPGEAAFGSSPTKTCGPRSRSQLPKLPKPQMLAEPVGRNTAPAIGLAAFLLLRHDPDAVIGMFPSDHVIGDEKRYREILQRGIEIAAAGENIVVLGIQSDSRRKPAMATSKPGAAFGENALRVRRFTEKPDARTRRRISGGRQLFLEQRHVPVERAHPGQRAARAPAQDRAAAREDCREPSARASSPRLSQALSQVRKHQHRLRRARAAFGQGRAGLATSSACPPISAGTTWAHGPRCTSITRAKSNPRRTAI